MLMGVHYSRKNSRKRKTLQGILANEIAVYFLRQSSESGWNIKNHGTRSWEGGRSTALISY